MPIGMWFAASNAYALTLSYQLSSINISSSSLPPAAFCALLCLELKDTAVQPIEPILFK